MMRACGLIACGLLAACASVPVVPNLTPAGQALLALDYPQYGAQLALAQEAAAGCARYSIDADTVAVLNNQRAPAGPGLNAAVQVETDVARRVFEGRHDVVIGQDDLCAAIDGEVASETPLSALLTPA